MKAVVKKNLIRPISRFDADDSRLLKKEFLRLIRVRLSIVRTLCGSDQMAFDLVRVGPNPKGEGFESDVEALIWKYVAMRLEADAAEKGANQ